MYHKMDNIKSVCWYYIIYNIIIIALATYAYVAYLINLILYYNKY